MRHDTAPLPDLFRLIPQADHLSALELGVALRLVTAAWSAEDPCTLEANPRALAMVARIMSEEWLTVADRVLLACGAERRGSRLVFVPALQVYQHQAQLRAKRSKAGQASGRSRAGRNQTADEAAPETAAGSEQHPASGVSRPVDWDVAGTHVEHVFNTCSAAPSMEARAHAQKRPRSNAQYTAHESLSAPDAAGAASSADPPADPPEDVIALVGLGAGARALARQEADRRWCRQMLLDAVWPWAAVDRRRLPPLKCGELSEAPGVTPMLVAYAIEQIDAMGRQAVDAGKTPPNPIGLLITALGAQRTRRTRPWEVPLTFATRFINQQASRDKLTDAQLAIEAIRTKRAAADAARALPRPRAM